MPSPRMVLVSEAGASKEILELVSRTGEAFGFEVENAAPKADSEDLITLLERLAQTAPLLVVLMDGDGACLRSLDRVPHLGNCLLMAVVDGSPSASLVWREAKETVTYARADERGLLLRLLSAFSRIRAEFEKCPARYVPVEKHTPETREPYRVLSLSKHVVVTPTGHGIVDFVYRLQVTGEGFTGTSHYFGITGEENVDAILPPLAQLMNRPPSDRYLGESFSCRLLSPAENDMRMDVVEILGESSERTKVFRFLFTPRPGPGQILTYAMSWSHPQIYAVYGKDASTLKCPHDFEELELSLLFMHDRSGVTAAFEPEGEPLLRLYNPLDYETAVLRSIGRVDLQGTRYSWRLFALPSHSTVLVEWERRRRQISGASKTLPTQSRMSRP